MIFVRNDDVILDSSGKYKGREFERFKFVHEQICRAPDKLLHCPAILCKEIQDFPQVIEYIYEETKEGRMRPYLHCWNHTDWTKKPIEQIEEMLARCDEWFNSNLDCEYQVWATPWGADTPIAREACRRLGIKLQSTAPTIEAKTASGLIRNGQDLDGNTILYHWWQPGLSLFRIVEVIVNGSWDAAKAAKPEWFK